MIKRSFSVVALLGGLLCSAGVFAGATPACNSDTFNMVIVNQNLVSDDCSSATGAGNYCLYYPGYHTVPLQQASCEDSQPVLWDNDSVSISEHHVPQSETITFNLGTKGSTNTKEFWFKVSNGMATDNCSEIFAGDVNCALTKTITNGRTTYKLMLSKVQ